MSISSVLAALPAVKSFWNMGILPLLQAFILDIYPYSPDSKDSTSDLSLKNIEVRDSRTGYFIPARYGLGLWPDGKIVGAPSPSSASSGKCPKYKEMHIFSKMGMSEISRNVNLAEIKAPAGAT